MYRFTSDVRRFMMDRMTDPIDTLERRLGEVAAELADVAREIRAARPPTTTTPTRGRRSRRGEAATSPITVRLTEHERAVVDRQAALDGVTPSEWIRGAIVRGLRPSLRAAIEVDS